ncbi:NAD-dependent epimerase/dehydratase family protein [Streptomyces flavofungini]|uniref:NAD(P)-dependent oxidoreductase n=1 Tax=Streptomyces flavofungini TaxID=68200 RepID=A0ABS0X6F2_9ACTN|nr:NAD(P)-dependent oxidoreductase [Streptomyces flavofungini]MBJ3808778.1 NAD(P)-dependent oxidoreductase [Streptomyces flavofungini]GHC49419.1 dTDP-glucose 4,6-dehydratase [Streptomyces flavofungini]
MSDQQSTGAVVLTGAAGKIGAVLRDRLRDRKGGLILVDRVAPPGPFAPHEHPRTVDLTDFAATVAAFEGAGAVVHMAGIPDEAPFADLLEANVLCTHHVLEAARRHGITRVVLASSNRAAGYYPNSHVTGPLDPVRPDGLYGVSKAAVEALGRMYADKFGLDVTCLRIGSFEEVPSEARHLATWLSHRDAGGYVLAALDGAPEPGRFEIVYAVSGNARRFWELTGAYSPVDDAAAYAGEIPDAAAAFDPDAPQSGGFAAPEFTLPHLP